MQKVWTNLLAGHYNKFLVAAAGAVLTVLAQLYGTDPRVAMFLSFMTAFGVYNAPNKEKVVL